MLDINYNRMNLTLNYLLRVVLTKRLILKVFPSCKKLIRFDLPKVILTCFDPSDLPVILSQLRVSGAKSS